MFQKESFLENLTITIQLDNIMGLFDLFGISGAVAPMSSFTELINLLRRNKEEEKEHSDDFVTDDNQEEQNEEG